MVALLLTMVWPQASGSHPPYTIEQAAAKEPASKGGREQMPDFTLPDTSGHRVSLSGFRGKVVLVDFWATWCAPCKKEMPGYEDLYRRYKRRGFVVVGIAADSNVSSVARFGRKLGITYPLLINGMNLGRYGVQGLPTTILVDRAGFIRKKVVGFEYKQAFENALKEIL